MQFVSFLCAFLAVASANPVPQSDAAATTQAAATTSQAAATSSQAAATSSQAAATSTQTATTTSQAAATSSSEQSTSSTTTTANDSGVASAVSAAGSAMASVASHVFTQAFLGSDGPMVNWGTTGPAPALEWLLTQCDGLAECPTSNQWTGGNWPAPLTGQNLGYMTLTVQTYNYDAENMAKYYIPAAQSYFNSKATTTAMPFEPPGGVGSMMPSGPAPSVTVIATPSYFGLKRCQPDLSGESNDSCPHLLDEFTVQATYVTDDSFAQFLCNAEATVAGVAGPWWGAGVSAICSEALG